jgi:hypothetical protein
MACSSDGTTQAHSLCLSIFAVAQPIGNKRFF